MTPQEKELLALEASYEGAKLENDRAAEVVDELAAERKRASEENKAATARLREQEQKFQDGKNQGCDSTHFKNAITSITKNVMHSW